MHRIDHATREIDDHGPGKDGFTEGSPGVTPATVVTADILDAFQEEIANVIEGAPSSAALVKADNTQLATAIEARISNRFVAGEIAFPAPVPMVWRFSAAEGVPQFPADWTRTQTHTAQSVVPNARFVWELTHKIPRSATITRVLAIVNLGTTRSGGDRLRLGLDYARYGTEGAPVLDAGEYLSGAGLDDPQPTGFGFVRLDAPMNLSLFDTVRVWVQKANDAQPDLLYGIEVQGNVPQLSPV